MEQFRQQSADRLNQSRLVATLTFKNNAILFGTLQRISLQGSLSILNRYKCFVPFCNTGHELRIPTEQLCIFFCFPLPFLDMIDLTDICSCGSPVYPGQQQPVGAGPNQPGPPQIDLQANTWKCQHPIQKKNSLVF